jgi:hypothetical protein
MDVKEWAQDELGQMARRAHKTVQPAINAAIDVRLLASFEIMDVWEMATPEQAQGRKDEWNRAKKEFIKNFTHGRKRRRALARAIVLNPNEAGAWPDELKKEANTQAIELRRTLHRLLGEVVEAQHLGEAQAIPEKGAPAEVLSDNELASGDLRMAVTTAHIGNLQEDMAGVNETSEASNETHKPDAEIKGVTFGFDVQMEDTGALDAEDDTEGEQAKEPEDDADANMSDWNEEDHAPTDHQGRSGEGLGQAA